MDTERESTGRPYEVEGDWIDFVDVYAMLESHSTKDDTPRAEKLACRRAITQLPVPYVPAGMAAPKKAAARVHASHEQAAILCRLLEQRFPKFSMAFSPR